MIDRGEVPGIKINSQTRGGYAATHGEFKNRKVITYTGLKPRNLARRPSIAFEASHRALSSLGYRAAIDGHYDKSQF